MKIDIDVIGTIYTTGTYDSEGNVTVAPVALPGYHVNTTFAVADWAGYKVTPTEPRRVFGGHETHFYTFADLAEYEAYLETADLTVPTQPVPVQPPIVNGVPQIVSMRQARLALNAAGLLDAVDAAVSAAPESVQIEWEYSGEINRNWPTLALLAGALGLTDEQLDALFTQAATL